jgi:hypothetical protein
LPFYPNGRLIKAKLSKKEHSSIVNKFCSTIEKAGYTACLYTNLTMIKNHYNISKINHNYTVWIARYNTQVSAGNLTYDGKYDFWQYSSKGAVEGIKGNVDLDHQYVMKPDKITDFYAQSNTPAAITEYTDETAEQGIEYDYKVRAFYKFQKGNRGGTYSDLVTAATIILLDPVRNLRETDCTDSTVTISWEAPAQATGYEIYRYDKAAEEYERIATIKKKKTTSFTDEGLEAGEKYDYQIRPFAQTKGGNFIYYGPMESISLCTEVSAANEGE